MGGRGKGGSLSSHSKEKKLRKAKILACLFCSYEAREYCQLENHMNSHTGERPYPCQDCDLYFRSLSTLRGHRQFRHMGIIHRCTFCGKQFSVASSLRQHRNRVHRDELEEAGNSSGRCSTNLPEIVRNIVFQRKVQTIIEDNISNTQITPRSPPLEQVDGDECEVVKVVQNPPLVELVDSEECEEVKVVPTRPKKPRKKTQAKSGEKAKKQWVCDICGNVFYRQDSYSLDRHKRTVHKDLMSQFIRSSAPAPLPPLPSLEVMSVKNKSTTPPTLPRTVVQDNKSNFNCVQKSKSGSLKIVIKKSKPSRRNGLVVCKEKRVWHCDICGKTFLRADDYSLKRHKRTVHRDVFTEQKVPPPQPIPVSSPPKQPSPTPLSEEAVISGSPEVPEIKVKPFSRRVRRRHRKVGGSYRFSLERKKRRNNLAKRFWKCELCESVFYGKDRRTLNRHLKNVHNLEEGDCFNLLPPKEETPVTIKKAIRTELVVFKPKNGKKAVLSGIQRRLWKCEICGSTFYCKDRHSLNRHLKNVHNQNQNLPIGQAQIPLQLPVIPSLPSPVASHSPPPQPNGKKLALPIHVNVAKKVGKKRSGSRFKYNEKRDWKCNFCGKVFHCKSRFNLNRHINSVHQGEEIGTDPDSYCGDTQFMEEEHQNVDEVKDDEETDDDLSSASPMKTDDESEQDENDLTINPCSFPANPSFPVQSEFFQFHPPFLIHNFPAENKFSKRNWDPSFFLHMNRYIPEESIKFVSPGPTQPSTQNPEIEQSVEKVDGEEENAMREESLECQKCGRVLSSKWSFKRHLNIRDCLKLKQLQENCLAVKGDFRCGFCRKEFGPSRYRLVRHISSLHRFQESMQCPDFEALCAGGKDKGQRRKYPDYSCAFCEVTAEFREDVHEHIMEVHLDMLGKPVDKWVTQVSSEVVDQSIVPPDSPSVITLESSEDEEYVGHNETPQETLPPVRHSPQFHQSVPEMANVSAFPPKSFSISLLPGLGVNMAPSPSPHPETIHSSIPLMEAISISRSPPVPQQDAMQCNNTAIVSISPPPTDTIKSRQVTSEEAYHIERTETNNASPVSLHGITTSNRISLEKVPSSPLTPRGHILPSSADLPSIQDDFVAKLYVPPPPLKETPISTHTTESDDMSYVKENRVFEIEESVHSPAGNGILSDFVENNEHTIGEIINPQLSSPIQTRTLPVPRHKQDLTLHEIKSTTCAATSPFAFQQQQTHQTKTFTSAQTREQCSTEGVIPLHQVNVGWQSEPFDRLSALPSTAPFVSEEITNNMGDLGSCVSSALRTLLQEGVMWANSHHDTLQEHDDESQHERQIQSVPASSPSSTRYLSSLQSSEAESNHESQVEEESNIESTGAVAYDESKVRSHDVVVESNHESQVEEESNIESAGAVAYDESKVRSHDVVVESNHESQVEEESNIESAGAVAYDESKVRSHDVVETLLLEKEQHESTSTQVSTSEHSIEFEVENNNEDEHEKHSNTTRLPLQHSTAFTFSFYPVGDLPVAEFYVTLPPAEEFTFHEKTETVETCGSPATVQQAMSEEQLSMASSPSSSNAEPVESEASCDDNLPVTVQGNVDLQIEEHYPEAAEACAPPSPLATISSVGKTEVNAYGLTNQQLPSPPTVIPIPILGSDSETANFLVLSSPGEVVNDQAELKQAGKRSVSNTEENVESGMEIGLECRKGDENVEKELGSISSDVRQNVESEEEGNFLVQSLSSEEAPVYSNEVIVTLGSTHLQNFESEQVFVDNIQSAEVEDDLASTVADDLEFTGADDLKSDFGVDLPSMGRGDRLQSTVGSNLQSKVDDHPESEMEDHLESEMEGHLESEIEDHLETEVDHNLESEVDHNLESEIEDHLESEVDHNLESEVDVNLEYEADHNLESEVEHNLESEVDHNLESEVDHNLKSEMDHYLESKEEENLKSEVGDDLHVQSKVKDELQSDVGDDLHLQSKVGEDLHSEVGDDLQSEVEDELQSEVEDELQSEVEDELQSEVEDELHSEVEDEIQSEVEDELKSEVRDVLQSEVGDDLQSEVGDKLQSEVGDDLQSEEGDDLKSEEGDDLQSEVGDELQSEVGDDLQSEEEDDLQSVEEDDHQSEERDTLQSEVENDLQSRMEDNLQSRMEDNLQSRVEDHLESKVGDDLEYKLRDNLRSKVGDDLRSKVGADLRSKVGDDLRSKVGNDLQSEVDDHLESVESVVGDHRESVVGDHRESVLGDHRESVVGDHRESVLGDHRESVVGDHRESVVGDHLESEVGDNHQFQGDDHFETRRNYQLVSKVADNIESEVEDNVNTQVEEYLHHVVEEEIQFQSNCVHHENAENVELEVRKTLENVAKQSEEKTTSNVGEQLIEGMFENDEILANQNSEPHAAECNSPSAVCAASPAQTVINGQIARSNFLPQEASMSLVEKLPLAMASTTSASALLPMPLENITSIPMPQSHVLTTSQTSPQIVLSTPNISIGSSLPTSPSTLVKSVQVACSEALALLGPFSHGDGAFDNIQSSEENIVPCTSLQLRRVSLNQEETYINKSSASTCSKLPSPSFQQEERETLHPCTGKLSAVPTPHFPFPLEIEITEEKSREEEGLEINTASLPLPSEISFLSPHSPTESLRAVSQSDNDLNKCRKCGKMMTNWRCLSIHKALLGDKCSQILPEMETGQVSSLHFYCVFCHKEFGERRAHLTRHIACIHSRNRSAEQEYDGKVKAGKDIFGGSQFSCAFCGMHNSRKDHLSMHILKRHRELLGRPRNLDQAVAQQLWQLSLSVQKIWSNASRSDFCSLQHEKDKDLPFKGPEVIVEKSTADTVQQETSPQPPLLMSMTNSVVDGIKNDLPVSSAEDFNEVVAENLMVAVVDTGEMLEPNKKKKRRRSLCEQVVKRRRVPAKLETRRHPMNPESGILPNGKKRWQCDICDKIFYRKDDYSLKRHKRNVHRNLNRLQSVNAGVKKQPADDVDITLSSSMSSTINLVNSHVKIPHQGEEKQAWGKEGPLYSELQQSVSSQVLSSSSPFKCKKCGQQLATLRSLRRHEMILDCHLMKQLREQPPSSFLYTCRFCGTEFGHARSKLVAHIVATHRHTCEGSSDSGHIASDGFSCAYCGSWSDDKALMHRHILLMHCQLLGKPLQKEGQEKGSVTKEELEESVSPPPLIAQNYVYESGAEDDDASDEDMPMLTPVVILDEEPGEIKLKEISSPPPPETSKQHNHTCEKCRKKFSSASSLKRHRRNVANCVLLKAVQVHSYACPFCNADFRQKRRQLINHIVRNHRNRDNQDKAGRFFSCGFCGEKRSSLKELEKHTLRKHLRSLQLS